MHAWSLWSAQILLSSLIGIESGKHARWYFAVKRVNLHVCLYLCFSEASPQTLTWPVMVTYMLVRQRHAGNIPSKFTALPQLSLPRQLMAPHVHFIGSSVSSYSNCRHQLTLSWDALLCSAAPLHNTTQLHHRGNEQSCYPQAASQLLNPVQRMWRSQMSIIKGVDVPCPTTYALTSSDLLKANIRKAIGETTKLRYSNMCSHAC